MQKSGSTLKILDDRKVTYNRFLNRRHPIVVRKLSNWGNAISTTVFIVKMIFV